MIDIVHWMESFMKALQETFGDRVWFVGLQGSYGRGEATEASDVDVVVILDQLSALDIQEYGRVLDGLPERERLCGFLSGKNEILHWDPSDLFSFYYDTKPVFGNLDALRPLLDESAVDRAIKLGVCQIFHGCVHNMLYERSDDVLKGLYKSAVFVIQAMVFRDSGRYISRHQELLSVVSGHEIVIVDTALRLRQGEAVALKAMSETLFQWVKGWIE